jgi:uncharacterized membrane protein
MGGRVGERAGAALSKRTLSIGGRQERLAMLLLALVIGLVAGLRAFTAPAAVAWGAAAGAVVTASSPLSFLGWRFAPFVLSVLAGLELVADQLPTTPSRTQLLPFGARLVSGALCGGAVGVDQAAPLAGVALGLAGAVIGTFGGYWLRQGTAAAFGRDRPAALIEDAAAIVAAVAVVLSL